MKPHSDRTMFPGYNTSGFAHHRLEDAINILADLGYRGIALTLDVHHLDPFAPDLLSRTAALRGQLERRKMSCAIETGARFLLDSVRKHQPTLISPEANDRQVRLRFLKQCVDIAAELNASCVSFWSGTATDDAPHDVLMRRLGEECNKLLDYIQGTEVVLAFEPEPGMFIDTMVKFRELKEHLEHPAFGLTIDLGHLVCNGELPISSVLVEWKDVLRNIHIEDMRRGTHDHLMFGEGEVDFKDAFSGLSSAGYAGGVYVELSRHSYNAVDTARRAKAFLDQCM
jgi:L-ribulose-5-phosphate 3-epimerase